MKYSGINNISFYKSIDALKRQLYYKSIYLSLFVGNNKENTEIPESYVKTHKKMNKNHYFLIFIVRKSEIPDFERKYPFKNVDIAEIRDFSTEEILYELGYSC